jgi:anaerobic selenocysteine-containing dehydrogenase
MQTRKTHCRICHAFCAMEVDLEAGRALRVRGDRADAVHGGYTCIKGQQMIEQHDHPDRLRSSLKRTEDGGFAPISSRDAMDEIASRTKQIIEDYGPRAVALYGGTNGLLVSGAGQVYRAWLEGIGSPSYYSSMTIDQPAKFFVAPSRHGIWTAGVHDFQTADVSLVIGANPLVSLYSGPRGGPIPYNPTEQIRQAKRRGLKLIAVDPRRTQFARQADLHLQVRPGEDATLLCGMLRVIFEEALYDREFCTEYANGLAELRAAVEAFTPDHVEKRTGVPAEQMVAAARLFGRGPRGAATSGTGIDMGPRGNLCAHLILALNTVCGRYRRAGDRLDDIEVLYPSGRRMAQVVPPWAETKPPVSSRIRGLPCVWDPRTGFAELPTSTLADEILTPGDGKVRALFCAGGNPIVAWPNQAKVRRALEALDLFVTLDIKLSASARLADYVIAPKLGLERDDVAFMMDSWSPVPYAHYARALLEPDFDVIEEWELFTGLARRMGTPIKLPGGEVPLDRPVAKHELLKLAFAQPMVPLDELRATEGGRVYPELASVIEAPGGASSDRLQLAPPGIPEEMRELRDEVFTLAGGYGAEADAFSHRLICRRAKHAYNSSARDLSRSRARDKTNPAYMNPDDLDALGVESGNLVEIESRIGKVLAVVRASDEITPGVVSMSHAWGDLPEFDAQVREIGSCIGRLVDDESEIDRFAGMPLQSALPVNVRRAPQSEGAV